MKWCKKCNAETRRYNDGKCAPCIARRGAAWRKINAGSEARREQNRRSYAKHRVTQLAQKAAYYKANPEKMYLRGVLSRFKCADKIREKNKAWARANPDKARAAITAWRKAHPENIRKAQEKYRLAHPDKNRAQASRRRALEKSQRCTCCTNKQIDDVFWLSDGEHIDHIVPLALGGLHCRHNLQQLSVKEHKIKTKTDMAAIVRARRETREANALLIYFLRFRLAT